MKKSLPLFKFSSTKLSWYDNLEKRVNERIKNNYTPYKKDELFIPKIRYVFEQNLSDFHLVYRYDDYHFVNLQLHRIVNFNITMEDLNLVRKLYDNLSNAISSMKIIILSTLLYVPKDKDFKHLNIGKVISRELNYINKNVFSIDLKDYKIKKSFDPSPKIKKDILIDDYVEIYIKTQNELLNHFYDPNLNLFKCEEYIKYLKIKKEAKDLNKYIRELYKQKIYKLEKPIKELMDRITIFCESLYFMSYSLYLTAVSYICFEQIIQNYEDNDEIEYCKEYGVIIPKYHFEDFTDSEDSKVNISIDEFFDISHVFKKPENNYKKSSEEIKENTPHTD